MLRKLFPTIPDPEYVCFYPMSKLRGEANNWFTLEKKDRGTLMFDHIKSAKPFTEQIKRIITGSIGLDDYEWGITLFCNDPLRFLKISMLRDLMKLVLNMEYLDLFILKTYCQCIK